MTLSSYSDVFGIDHNRGHDEDISVGDLVSTGPNLSPYFEVLALNGEKAWLRNLGNGSDHLALIARCRRLNSDALMAAAE